MKTEAEILQDAERTEEWDEVYPCAFCEDAFTNEHDLTVHRETAHEMNEE